MIALGVCPAARRWLAAVLLALLLTSTVTAAARMTPATAAPTTVARALPARVPADPPPSGQPSAAASPAPVAPGPSPSDLALPATPPATAAPAASTPVAVPPGVTAGIAVFDRQSGTFAVQQQATLRFRSASLVKLLIALDYLWDRGPGYAIPVADRGRFDVMLRSSDDTAASTFWNRDGSAQIVTRMIARLALQDTAVPSARPGWGYTAISAADIVRIYRYILDAAPSAVRDEIMGDLHQSTRCGTDAFDQSFGIPSGFSQPWSAKQGWSGFGRPAHPCTTNAVAPAAVTMRPFAAAMPVRGTMPLPATMPIAADVDIAGAVLHTTGTVGTGDRWIVAVLTLHPRGTPFPTASAALTRLTRSLPVPGGR